MLEPILADQNKDDLTSSPKISFSRIKNTRIKIDAIKAESPFWLVFGESFHPQWQAYVVGKNAARISLNEHYLVNAYCNGWFIRPEELQELGVDTEELKIVLDFIPQHIAFRSKLISLLFLLGSIMYIVRDKRTKLKRKKK